MKKRTLLLNNYISLEQKNQSRRYKYKNNLKNNHNLNNKNSLFTNLLLDNRIKEKVLC